MGILNREEKVGYIVPVCCQELQTVLIAVFQQSHFAMTSTNKAADLANSVLFGKHALFYVKHSTADVVF